MANTCNVRSIIESYNEITIEQEISESIFMLSLFDKQFLFIAPEKDDSTSRVDIYLYNNDGADFPHVMLKETAIDNACGLLPAGVYRYVCLYEHESIVFSVISYEDKVYDTINRLIELLSMNRFEIEREFQKEFMYYWNFSSCGTRKYFVYLSQDTYFSKMELFFGAKQETRIIEPGLDLSDINDRVKNERKWIQHFEYDSFFIPITDCRGIVPPHRGFCWTAEEISNIIYNYQIEHISFETYQKLKCTIPKTKDIIIVFGISFQHTRAFFAVLIKCKNLSGRTLQQKLMTDILATEPLYTKRSDYLALNQSIGNDVSMIGKKVLLVGAGSLGSYVAFELVKNGTSSLTVFDGDILEEENVLRWAYGGIGKGSNKAQTLEILLNLLHPQIRVTAVPKDIDEEAIVEQSSLVDMVIITIGNSDTQLKLNRALKDARSSIPVIYVWLEAGGENSHILLVNYQKNGCFECLYTDSDGKPTNNRSIMSSEDTYTSRVIHNGCGGTRAAYGTAILCRTVAALLELIGQIATMSINESKLIDISADHVMPSDTCFPLEVCNCCGTAKQ